MSYPHPPPGGPEQPSPGSYGAPSPGQQYPGQQYPGQQYPGQQYPGQQSYPGQSSAAPDYQGYGAPPAPPGKTRRTWLWVILGIFGVLVLGIGGCSYYVYQLARGPVDGANVWLAMVDEGDLQGAYDSSCEATRAAVDPATYAAELETDFAGGIDGYSLTNVANNNGVVSVNGTVDVAGLTRDIEFILRNEDGWSVCSYVLF